MPLRSSRFVGPSRARRGFHRHLFSRPTASHEDRQVNHQSPLLTESVNSRRILGSRCLPSTGPLAPSSCEGIATGRHEHTALPPGTHFRHAFTHEGALDSTACRLFGGAAKPRVACRLLQSCHPRAHLRRLRTSTLSGDRSRPPSDPTPHGAGSTEVSQVRGRMTFNSVSTPAVATARHSGFTLACSTRAPTVANRCQLRAGIARGSLPCGNGLNQNRLARPTAWVHGQPLRAASPAPPRKGTSSAAPEVLSARGSIAPMGPRPPCNAPQATRRMARRHLYQPRSSS